MLNCLGSVAYIISLILIFFSNNKISNFWVCLIMGCQNREYNKSDKSKKEHGKKNCLFRMWPKFLYLLKCKEVICFINLVNIRDVLKYIEAQSNLSYLIFTWKTKWKCLAFKKLDYFRKVEKKIVKWAQVMKSQYNTYCVLTF